MKKFNCEISKNKLEWKINDLKKYKIFDLELSEKEKNKGIKKKIKIKEVNHPFQAIIEYYDKYQIERVNYINYYGILEKYTNYYFDGFEIRNKNNNTPLEKRYLNYLLQIN